MPHLAFEKIPQSVSHGASRVGERLLGGQFNFSMGQPGDVGELPSDFSREGKEVLHTFFHDNERLPVGTHSKQAFGASDVQ
jgi:hypothetical protein